MARDAATGRLAVPSLKAVAELLGLAQRNIRLLIDVAQSKVGSMHVRVAVG